MATPEEQVLVLYQVFTNYSLLNLILKLDSWKPSVSGTFDHFVVYVTATNVAAQSQNAKVGVSFQIFDSTGITQLGTAAGNSGTQNYAAGQTKTFVLTLAIDTPFSVVKDGTNVQKIILIFSLSSHLSVIGWYNYSWRWWQYEHCSWSFCSDL